MPFGLAARASVILGGLKSGIVAGCFVDPEMRAENCAIAC